MPFQGAEDAGGIVTGVVVYIGVIVAAFWLAMVIWTFRDMRARSRDALVPFIVGLLVAVLNVPGLLIYLFLRPRETLSEAYERSLEEEALLQSIEGKATCPGCRQAVREDWQACPNCHTRLKKPCVRCGKMLDLAWDLCPYCASAQPTYAAETIGVSSHARPSEPYIGDTTAAYDNGGSTRRRSRRAESVEFVEE